MDNYTKIDIDNLIDNEDFIAWVIKPTPENDQYWNQYILENPSSKEKVEETIRFLKKIVPEESELTNRKVEKLWSNIERYTFKRKNKNYRLYGWTAAAGFFIIIGLSFLFFMTGQTPQTPNNRLIVEGTPSGKDIKLIFSDNSEKKFNSNDLNIKYNSNGKIEVNSEEIEKKENQIGKRTLKEEQLNQLVVPKGKRTSLTLSDGTKMYLNSDSYAIFPVIFLKGKREIFVEGEAYFEVAHNDKKPFIVNTKNLSVKVLGTKFCISAYPDDSFSSVVLEEGSVQAKIESHELTIKPNQVLIYQRETKDISLEEANILPYISWKDGWLYCQKEKLGTIANKLSRYYDIEIEFKDAEAAELTLNGKLDLKSECSDIFYAISSIAPISCSSVENKIVVSKK